MIKKQLILAYIEVEWIHVQESLSSKQPSGWLSWNQQGRRFILAFSNIGFAEDGTRSFTLPLTT